MRPVVAEHRDAAAQPARRRDRVALGAEDVLGELLQDQGHTDGRQQRVERPFVHPLDDGDLEQQPEEAGDDEGHREATTIEMPVLVITCWVTYAA